MRRRVYLENVVTVVNALHAFDASTPEIETLSERQARGAYMIVLNRLNVDDLPPRSFAQGSVVVRMIVAGCSPTAARRKREIEKPPVGQL